MLIISGVTVKISVHVRGFSWNAGSCSLPVHFCMYHEYNDFDVGNI